MVSTSTLNTILLHLTWVRFSQYEVEVINGGKRDPTIAKDQFHPCPLTEAENAARMSASLDDTHEQALKRWRVSWKANVELTAAQKGLRQRLPHDKFNRKSHTCFNYGVNGFVGDTHLAQSRQQVERLAGATMEAKKVEAPARAPLKERRACR